MFFSFLLTNKFLIGLFEIEVLLDEYTAMGLSPLCKAVVNFSSHFFTIVVKRIVLTLPTSQFTYSHFAYVFHFATYEYDLEGLSRIDNTG